MVAAIEAVGYELTIRDGRDYDAAVERLNVLIDEIGDDEQHALYGLLDTLGTLVHAYEEEHVPIPEASGLEALEFLMEEHGLSPANLPELGTEQTVLAVLAKKRELHVGEIRALANHFRVSPAVFV